MKMRVLLLTCFFGLCLLPADSLAQSTDLPALKIGEHTFHRRVLANGLRASVVQDERESVTVFLAVGAGNRDETAETTGLAHLTEHAMFAGTPTTGTDAHEKTIVEWGGESNAYTREDYTMYYDHNFPVDKLGQVLKMEADRLVNLSLDPEPTLHERYRLKKEEEHAYQPSEGRDEQLENAVFQTHPYRHGLRDENGHTKGPELSVEQIRGFYQQHYHPNRVALVIVGPADPKEALDLVEAAFGHLPSSSGLRGENGQGIPSEGRLNKRNVALDSVLPRSRKVLNWMIPEMGHPDRAPLALLAGLMGRAELDCGIPLSVGMGGRVDPDLFQLDYAAAATEDPEADGLLLMRASSEVNALVQNFRDGSAVQQSAGHGEANNACEFDEVKNLMIESSISQPLRARPYFAMAAVFARFDVFGQAETFAGFADDMAAVNPEDVTRVAKKYLNPNACVTVTFHGTGEALEPLPETAKLIHEAAAQASETGNLQRAIEAYTKVMPLQTDRMNSVINLFYRGSIYVEMGNYDAGIADYEAALKIVDYPAVRDALEEAHARKARAMRGEFENMIDADADPHGASPHAIDPATAGIDPNDPDAELKIELLGAVQKTMTELEDWRGLRFMDDVHPDFIDVSDSPDEKLGGWYEPDTKRLVVIFGKDKKAGFTRGVQLHEIFHALQDQTWGLIALDEEAVSSDQMRAIQAVTEGEAMYAVSDIMDYNFDQHTVIPETGEITRDKYEKLFHYGTGLKFVRALHQQGGWPAVNRCWGRLPMSTSELFHPERYGQGSARRDFEMPMLEFDASVLSGEVIDEDVWGEFELRWLLTEDENTRGLVEAIANELVADRWYKVAREDDDYEIWGFQFATTAAAESLVVDATAALTREGWVASVNGKVVILSRFAELSDEEEGA